MYEFYMRHEFGVRKKIVLTSSNCHNCLCVIIIIALLVFEDPKVQIFPGTDNFSIIFIPIIVRMVIKCSLFDNANNGYIPQKMIFEQSVFNIPNILDLKKDMIIYSNYFSKKILITRYVLHKK